MYICVHVCVPRTCGGHKRVLSLLELEFQRVVSYHVDAENSPRSYERPGGVINHGAISPASTRPMKTIENVPFQAW